MMTFEEYYDLTGSVASNARRARLAAHLLSGDPDSRDFTAWVNRESLAQVAGNRDDYLRYYIQDFMLAMAGYGEITTWVS